MGHYEEKYKHLTDELSKESIFGAVFGVISFIVYGKYLFENVLSMETIDPLAALVVVLSSAFLFLFSLIFSGFYTPFLQIAVLFFFDQNKEKQDARFIAEHIFHIVYFAAVIGMYHGLIHSAADGFGFYTSIFCVLGTLFGIFILESNHQSNVQFLASLFYREPAHSSAAPIKETTQEDYSLLFQQLEESNDSLQADIRYISTHVHLLTDTELKHNFHRTVRDLPNLLQNFDQLDKEDKEEAQTILNETMDAIAKDMASIRQVIRTIKRNEFNKSIFLQQKRTSSR